MAKPPEWSETEKKILLKYFPTESKESISAVLNRTFGAIYKKANNLGIHRIHRIYNKSLPLEVRFNKSFMPEPNSGCWLWIGKTSKGGYGSIRTTHNGERRDLLAHRLSWEMHCGPIPKELFVLHHCDTPSCVNPQHLFLGTDQDNKDDCCKKKRQAYGSRNGNAKLTEIDVIKIMQDTRAIRKISESFGISRNMVYDIRNRKFWKHLLNSP